MVSEVREFFFGVGVGGGGGRGLSGDGVACSRILIFVKASVLY